MKFSLRERLALSSSPSCFSTRDVDEKNDTRRFRERNTSFFCIFFFCWFSSFKLTALLPIDRTSIPSDCRRFGIDRIVANYRALLTFRLTIVRAVAPSNSATTYSGKIVSFLFFFFFVEYFCSIIPPRFEFFVDLPLVLSLSFFPLPDRVESETDSLGALKRTMHEHERKITFARQVCISFGCRNSHYACYSLSLCALSLFVQVPRASTI